MDSHAEASTTVLYYEPDPRPLRYTGPRAWLMWPAWAFRVLAPGRPRRKMNLFQQMVLGLCSAGERKAVDIGRRLDLKPDFAAYVLMQLHDMGLLDDHAMPTHRGRKFLAEEKESDLEPVSGHVFFDPFRAALWPRFIPGALPAVDVEWAPSSWWARVMPQPEGNPRGIDRTRVILPPSEQPPAAPGSRVVLSACQSSLRALEDRQAAEGGTLAGLPPSLGMVELKRRLSMVRVVEDRPEPVFLVTYMFMPEQGGAERTWQVCDPFGLGVSYQLRTTLEQVMEAERQKGRERPVSQSVEWLTEHGMALDSELVRSSWQVASKEAADRVQMGLGQDLKGELPELFSQLREMELALGVARHVEKGQELEASVARPKVAKGLRCAHTALEVALAQLVEMYPPHLHLTRLSQDPDENLEMLLDIAQSLGFQEGPEGAELQEICRVSKGAVLGAVQSGFRELAALVAAALLASEEHPDHPLRRIVRSNADLLYQLRNIKFERDEAAHHRNERSDNAVGIQVRKETYRAIRALIPPPVKLPRSGEQDKRKKSQGWDARVLHVMRARAASRLAMELGRGVHELPGLRGALLDLLQTGCELEVLRDGGATDEELEGLRLDLIVEAAICMEATMDHLIWSSEGGESTAARIGERRENMEMIKAAMAELGFDLGEEGAFPEALAQVNPERLRIAIQSGCGALAARLCAAILQVQGEEEHPMAQLAGVAPTFVLTAARIADMRGHGDRVKISVGETEELISQVLELARGVMQVALI